MFSLAAVRLRASARQAAREGRWKAAVDSYRAYLDRRPGDARSWVQYGHAAKETGDLRTAAAAYGCALAIDPRGAETWWHLSQVRSRQGDPVAAIDCCAQAIALDPGFTRAIDMLIASGAHDRIPTGMAVEVGRPDARPMVADPGGTPTVYARSRYDAYRRALTIPPPPRGAASGRSVTIWIDARHSLPAELRATLYSLLDQTASDWRAAVRAPAAIRDHSVASLAAIDPRVVFTGEEASPPAIDDAPWVLMIAAGTTLDRQALAWFGFVATRTGCLAGYGDHDHSVDDWRTGRRYRNPIFQTMFDPAGMRASDTAPIAVFVDQTRFSLAGWDHQDAIRILHAASSMGTVTHVPLLLTSRQRLADQAEAARADPPGSSFARRPPPVPRAIDEVPAIIAPLAIQVIVQTRDAPDMLRAAIDTLRSHAVRPDLLDVTIVDNRSVEPATKALLDDWRERTGATVLTLDEPFNWSRANNLAAEQGSAPLLLFLNNDTEMVTDGWDEALRRALSVEDVGGVGAMLLYPDRTIQHGGIVMGMGSGGPVHEGVGRRIDEGPLDRWRRPRSAAAVTGAFLAMRRDVFTAIDGFDGTRFAVAFNDIDLCLRVRAMGLRILMTDIQVIHHESKTRGVNVTRSQVAWDLGELSSLHDRWGAALFDDPAYNPHWARSGQPFDAYRIPMMRDIMRHIDLSARTLPWAPSKDEPVWW